MADVQALLKSILTAVYGKDVRQNFHDAIRQCYYDVKAGGNDLEARDRAAAAEARMDTFTKLAEGSTTGDAELKDIRIGLDGTVYTTAGTAVREQIRDTHTIEVTAVKPTRDNTQLWLDPTKTETVKVQTDDGKFVELNYNVIMVKNANGEWEGFPALKGESVYDIAVRHGYVDGEDKFIEDIISDGWVNTCLSLENNKANKTDLDDFYKKDESLTDDIKTKFGFGANATPANIFDFLSKYNLHWWKMRGYGAHYEATVKSNSDPFKYSVPSSGGANFYYSDTISVSQTDGTITLVNHKSVHVEWGQASGYSKIIGKYVGKNAFENLTEVQKFDSDVTFDSVGSGSSLVTTFNGGVQTIYGVFVEEVTDWRYVFSQDSEAYPTSGIVGGYQYEYLGVPFDNTLSSTKFVTGQYTGTGTTKRTISLGFKPRVVFLFGFLNSQASSIIITEIGNSYFTSSGSGTSVLDSSNFEILEDGFMVAKTYSWFNESGKSNAYLAIG